MVQLETREQALAYLAEMSPTQTFQVHPFPHGWVATTVLTREQIEAGQGLGMARLVIDVPTGIIYEYPSWAVETVAETHTEFKKTGIARAGRRIYPYQWSITIQRTAEDDQTIVYHLTATSLTDPPEPTQQHPVTIQKQTYSTDPRDWLSAVAMSYAEWMSRQNQGVWPETATTQV